MRFLEGWRSLKQLMGHEHSGRPLNVGLNNYYRFKLINRRLILVCPGINNLYRGFVRESFDVLLWFPLNLLLRGKILYFTKYCHSIVGSLHNFTQDSELVKANFERVESFISVQHGGNYGELEANYIEECEKRYTDKFVFWKPVANSGVVQTRYGPLHFLRIFLNSFRSPKVIFVGGAFVGNDSRWPTYADYYKLDYKKFINNISENYQVILHPESEPGRSDNVVLGSALNRIGLFDTVIFDGTGHSLMYLCDVLYVNHHIYVHSELDLKLFSEQNRNFLVCLDNQKKVINDIDALRKIKLPSFNFRLVIEKYRIFRANKNGPFLIDYLKDNF